MLVGLSRRPAPEMGFSLTGAIRSVVSAPLNIATGVTHDVLGAGGSIVSDALGVAGKIGGAAGSAVAQTAGPIGGALQNLRPQAPVVTPASSNLPLYIGGGVALLVVVLLLTRSKAPAVHA